jgi:hypothetical protein
VVESLLSCLLAMERTTARWPYHQSVWGAGSAEPCVPGVAFNFPVWVAEVVQLAKAKLMF